MRIQVYKCALADKLIIIQCNFNLLNNVHVDEMSTIELIHYPD